MAALKGIDESIKALAQRNHSFALRAMATVTQKEAARLLGCAESTVCDFKDEQLERAMQVLAALGLKVVKRADQMIPQDELDAYLLLARKALERGPAIVTDFGELT